MDQRQQADLARRTLALVDAKTTAMAATTMEDPVEGYRSTERFDRERTLVFSRFPQFVGMSSELAGPGSWKTFDATGTPILLTRDEEGRLRAMLNLCQHRGVTVVPSGCGDRARRFSCPFHGWTYDVRGRLVGIPGSEGFSDIDRSERGLVELPARERHGMMFVSASPEAPFDLARYFAGLDEQFESFGFGTWKPVAAVHEHPIKANWKVAWGTHCETYHFAVLHKNTVGSLVYGNTSLADFYGDHALMTTTMRSIDDLRHVTEDQWYPVDQGQINLNYRLFPNLSMSVVFGNRLEIFTVYPGERIDESFALHYAYARDVPDDETERKELEEAVRYACRTVVDGEDYRMAELSQRALKSPSAPKTLVYGRNEPVMQRMAATLRRVLDTSDR